MDIADVLGFWAVSAVFVVAPGSDWAAFRVFVR